MSYGFIGLAMRQHLIRRWSLMRCVSPESVLEHTASVTMLTLIAGTIARERGKVIDLERLMGHAVVHDLSEVLCSDIVTPVKNATPALRAEFRKLEDAAEKQLIGTLPDSLQDPIQSYFELEGYEETLFKACDVYAAFIKCKLEIAAGDSAEFQQAFDTLSSTLEALKGECEEIEILDDWFGGSIGVPVDQLMARPEMTF